MTAPIVPVLVDVDGVINAHWNRPGDLDHWPADTWQHARVPVTWAGVTVDVAYSTPVIERLRRIDAMPSTSLRWCTTWRADAATSLAPVLGLGADWPVADRDVPDELEWLGWWKAARAYELTQAHERVVWIDDEAAVWVARMFDADLGDAMQWINDDILIVSPDLRRGLTADELDEIEEFLT